jgi:hypothetical protein
LGPKKLCKETIQGVVPPRTPKGNGELPAESTGTGSQRRNIENGEKISLSCPFIILFLHKEKDLLIRFLVDLRLTKNFKTLWIVNINRIRAITSKKNYFSLGGGQREIEQGEEREKINLKNRNMN